ncbi:MAG: lamin tail domain-containing protein, partial [Melioribacteraceae bacterium]|nr:lamin tail domain-containing protein [Melioribacteraceae bacterium]
MFSPSESNSEFIEIYNSTNDVVNLENFKIKYQTSSDDNIISINSNYNLYPGMFAVIFEGDYDIENGIYKEICDSCLVFIIDDNSFGRSGMANSSSRKVSLINVENDTVDAYYYSPDNPAGYSDERIDYKSNNWANSITFNGTPGIKNSVSPREYDLSIIEFKSSRNYALVGESIQLSITLHNSGVRKAEKFGLNIYFQLNNSIRIFSEKIDMLNSGDSIFRGIIVEDIIEGENYFYAEVDYSMDEYSHNDTAYL